MHLNRIWMFVWCELSPNVHKNAWKPRLDLFVGHLQLSWDTSTSHLGPTWCGPSWCEVQRRDGLANPCDKGQSLASWWAWHLHQDQNQQELHNIWSTPTCCGCRLRMTMCTNSWPHADDTMKLSPQIVCHQGRPFALHTSSGVGDMHGKHLTLPSHRHHLEDFEQLCTTFLDCSFPFLSHGPLIDTDLPQLSKWCCHFLSCQKAQCHDLFNDNLVNSWSWLCSLIAIVLMTLKKWRQLPLQTLHFWKASNFAFVCLHLALIVFKFNSWPCSIHVGWKREWSG